MSSRSFSQQPQVQSILENCRRQIRNNALLAGLSSVCLVIVAGIVLAAGLDYLLPLPSVVRAGLLAVLILAIGVVIYRSLIQPFQGQLSDQQLGAAVDLSAPELQESLATLLSIESPTATSAEAGSPVMQRHLQRHVSGRISMAVPSDVVDLSTTRKRCGMAGFVLCLAMVPVVLWPSVSGLLLNRLVSPFQNLSTVSNLYFHVTDANRTVARSSDVEIVAVPKWRNKQSDDLPEAVQLIVTSSDGATDTLPMLFDETQSAYVAVLISIADSVDYQVSAPQVTSEVFHFNVVDRPAIQTAVMVDSPPTYTGRAIQTFDGMLGDMEVFEGSQLEIELTFNKPVSEAKLVWLGRDAVPVAESDLEEIKHDAMTGEEVILLDQDPDAPMAAEVIDVQALPTELMGTLNSDGTAAVFEFTAEAGGDFEFAISDQHRLLNVVTTSRHLTVTYDQPPELKVGGIQDGDHFRPEDIVPLNCLASDDIGLGEVQLHYRIGDDVERIVPATDFEAGSLVAQTGFRLPLVDLNLENGTVISLKVKAADERPVPGPQVTWCDALSVTIDSNAAAAGADAVQAESEGLIAALKMLQKLLLEDENVSRKLSEKIRQDFSDESKAETERLSEKEQQQGRILEQLAQQVASHPLMKDSADKLQELSGQLRQDIPDTLDDAIDDQRKEASRKIEDAAEKIQDVRNDLGREIKNIEKAARLEQELAELNRLALQADQLAKDSKQLDDDRRNDDTKPDDMDQQQWDRQLQDRQAQLQQKQQDLTQDIEQLLQQQNELRKAAQNAQQNKLVQLAEDVQRLADQQKTVAQGAQEKARETGRDAVSIANDLEKVRRQSDKLNQQLDQLNIDRAKADIEGLKDAVDQLRKGDLDDARQNVSKAADDASQLEQTLEGEQNSSDAADGAVGEPKDGASENGESQGLESSAAKSQPSTSDGDQAADDETLKQRQQAAGEAEQVQSKLQEIEEQIRQLQSDKNVKAAEPPASSAAANAKPTAQETETGSQSQNSSDSSQQQGSQQSSSQQSGPTSNGSPQPGSPPSENPQPATSQSEAPQSESTAASPSARTDEDQQVRSLLEQLQKAAESANDLAKAAAADPRASGNAQRSARQTSERASQGLQQAAAGRFDESAKQLGKASSSADAAGAQLNNESQQAQQQQAEALSQDLGRLAETMRGLQQDDASEIAAQQQTQAEVAEQAAELPQRLKEIQEALEIPALQMQKEAQQTGQASDAAEQAADTSQQAAENLEQGNLGQAGQEGRETAEQLQNVADAALRAGQQAGQQPSEVPDDIGQSVVDALQQLQQAAEAMQPSSGQSQPGQAQPGDAQPGEAQPSQPASGSEPSQTSNSEGAPSDTGQPGQPSETGSSSGQPSANGQPGSGSKPLSDAAESLAQAARQSLPGQFRPSDPSNTDSDASGDAGNGSSALWNGLIPNASGAVGRGKNWGQLVDELDTNTSGSMGNSRDAEYEALIRMYFREVAKSTEKGK